MDSNINKNGYIYVSPEIHVIDIEAESIICASGDIEPITFEDW